MSREVERAQAEAFLRALENPDLPQLEDEEEEDMYATDDLDAQLAHALDRD